MDMMENELYSEKERRLSAFLAAIGTTQNIGPERLFRALDLDRSNHGEEPLLESSKFLLKPLMYDLFKLTRERYTLDPDTLMTFKKVSATTEIVDRSQSQVQPQARSRQSESAAGPTECYPSKSSLFLSHTSQPSQASQFRLSSGAKRSRRSRLKRKKGRSKRRSAKRHRADTGEMTSVPTSNTYKLYIRSITFATVRQLIDEVVKYRGAYPGDTLWADTCLKSLESLSDFRGKTCMMYAGATYRNATVRMEEDQDSQWRRWSNWMESTNSRGKSYDVFQYDTGIPTNRFELRNQQDLQDLERSLIACLGACLNSARGGVTASLCRPPLAPNSPIDMLSRSREPWPHTNFVETAMRDSRRFYDDLPPKAKGGRASDFCFSAIVRHAQRGSTYHGTFPTFAYGSDITYESLLATQPGLGFSDTHTGYGPRVTDQVRLNALGLDHRQAFDDKVALNVFMDFWGLCVDTAFTWVPILQSARIFLELRPVLVRSCSSRLAQLLIDGAFQDVFRQQYNASDQIILDRFLAGYSPQQWTDLERLVDPKGLEVHWDSTHCYQWAKLVGKFYIVPIRKLWVLVLPDFDGGIVKYDPILAEVIADMKKVIALKGVAAEEVIMEELDKKAVIMRDLESMARLRIAIIQRCRESGLEEALDALRQRYINLQKVVVRFRHLAKWKKIVEHEIELGIHEEAKKARGDHSRSTLEITRSRHWIARGAANSDERVAQFEQARSTSKRLNTQGLLALSAQRPPRFYTHAGEDDWRSWWLFAVEGRDLTSSAYAFNGHPTRYMTQEEKKVYGERVKAGEASHRKLAWLSAKSIEEMAPMLASPSYFTTSSRRRDHRLMSCRNCGVSACGTYNLKHICVNPDLTLEEASQEIKERNLQPKAGRDSGLVSISLVFPHDVIDHPTFGFASNDHPSLRAWLTEIGMEAIDPLPILQRAQNDFREVFDLTQPVGIIRPIYVLLSGRTKDHDIHASVDRWLQARSQIQVPKAGRTPADLLFDDIPKYTENLNLFDHLLNSTTPLFVHTCTHLTPCSLFLMTKDAGSQPHDCPSIYKPILEEYGLGLAKMKKTNPGVSLTFPTKVGAKVTSFRDLCLHHQQRLYEAFARPSDPRHRDIAKEIFGWSSKS